MAIRFPPEVGLRNAIRCTICYILASGFISNTETDGLL